MITIYAPNATDFSTLGLGALAPYECTVEEQAGGMYELTMSHPMDEAGKWLNIGIGCIIKAPAPVRETPLAVEDGEGTIPSEPETVTRRIYRVRTNTGANLHLRQGPSTSTRILSKYRPGTEVVVLSQSGGWGQVIVCSSGASGYMSMQYLVYVRDEVETIAGDAPSPERVVYPVQSRMQLFRIYKVERDAAEREVRVEARHIFYDLLGDPTKNEYAPEGAAANTVVEELFERALDPHGFTVHSQLTGTVTGEYTRRGLVECLLDPDDGVLPQTNGRLIRDNFDIWLLPDLPRETGVTIRHGKNLLGATLTTDWDSLVTRIIPVGQDKEGKALLLEGTTYIDSPHIGDYPVICAQAVEYDVKVGQEGIDNAAQARSKLTELAEADFSDNGVDLPTVGLDVDFVALGETEEYKKYADLEAVHLYDTVRVIAKSAGIDAAVRVTGYKWDALGKKYEAVTLGEITDLKTTVYGYELPNQGIKTVKIAPGAVGSAQLRELAVQYAHINTAAVEQLSANSITALKAYIHELVAESITTDQLYADIATIALAQITTANIENANIDWAQIGTLVADIATIAKAHLGDADIDWAQIDNLTAAVAEIAQVEIGEAVIDGAQITDGTITNAKIENAAIDTAKIALGAITTALIATGAVGTAQIADGSITSAKIVSLDADVINAGTLSVDRLLLKGPDGLFVAINATDEGLTSEQLSQEEYQSAISGTVLVARSVTADKIAAKSITANEIAAGAITTAELAAESVDASKIKAGSITTSHVAANFGETLDISSNKQVEIIAGDVQQAQETADSAQEAAEQAAPYISATPPEEAPEAGKMWVDEGVAPSVLRSWRGADVPTAREFEAEFAQTGKNIVNIYAMEANYDDTTARAAAGKLRVATSGEGGAWRGAHTKPFLVYGGTTYTLSATLEAYASGYARVGLRERESRTFVSGMSVVFGTSPGTLSVTFTPAATMNVFLSALCTSDTVLTGDCTFADIQLEISGSATAYAEYEAASFVALNNEDGQIERAETTARCRAKQAGTGEPSPENTRAISGRESVEIRACGKNLVDLSNLYVSTSNAEMGVSGDSVRVYTTGDGGTWRGARTPAFRLHAGTTYALSAKLDKYVSGDARIGLRGADDNTFLSGASLVFGSGTGSLSATFTPDADDEVYLSLLCTNSTALTGDCTFSNIQLEIGGAATEYEPYRSMGGGTVTPTEPLYGLPGAEDTVEVSVDGDVLVTHRTAIVEVDGAGKSAVASTTPCAAGAYAYVTSATGALQMEDFPALCSHFAAVSKAAPTAQRTAGRMMTGLTSSGVPNIWFFSDQPTVEAFNAWLAAQSDAGTAVTLVYAMAAPEAEALTAVAPIAPQPGQVNILTDADALTATIYGSGWETVNDTGDLRSGLSEVDSTLAALEEEFGILGNTVAQHAEFIVSPDKIFAQVAEASKYNEQINALRVEIEANADGITLRKEEIEAIGGRVSNIESGVHIDGSDIGLYSSDSPFETHVTHQGVVISENDMPTITVKENKMTSPRAHITDSLIFGADAAVAFRCVNGHFMMLRYGG